jgi:hypothetical protein
MNKPERSNRSRKYHFGQWELGHAQFIAFRVGSKEYFNKMRCTLRNWNYRTDKRFKTKTVMENGIMGLLIKRTK